VAWAASPVFDTVVRLGPVSNGTSPLGELALERFLLLVTAEASAEVAERFGKVVLRGETASNRMRPPDIYEFALGAEAGKEHLHHGNQPDSLGWTNVPMVPGLQMPPAEMRLRPGVRAWLPPQDAPAPPVRPREILRLASGDTLALEAGLVRRTIAGRSTVMYGFNGQQPGPLLVVPRGAEITVRVRNGLPQETTVHWHGLRLENRFDGVPGATQDPIPPGGEFTYRLRFPDGGIFWYHPHVREDIQQDLGLAGNILVTGRGSGAPVDREEVLLLDDLLVADSGLVPYGADAPTHALMGRFGNLPLVNGEPAYRLTARQGEVVRFYLTNASSTRTWNLGFPGARMKVVGSDLSPYERESWVESVVIAPAERYVVHVRFDRPGTVAMVSRVRAIDHLFGRFFGQTDTLGLVEVTASPVSGMPYVVFTALAEDTMTRREADDIRRRAATAIERELVLSLQVRLPFLAERLMRKDSVFFNPVEWSGTMPGMNWAATGREVRWLLRDPATGREDMAIDWRFRVGDLVRIRLANERTVFHGMQHPIHLHGQRFLVLEVNGLPNDNLVWKDTVLVPAGGTVDLLLELSNPGRWMLHCHIAEHLAAGMMMTFDVTP
jgi:FtsP/CotA-like multicopper oxidase with cupredoxin domain